MIPRDGFCFLFLSPINMIESFTCIPFISECGFLIMQSFRLQKSAILYKYYVTFSDVIRLIDVNLNDVLYNQCISTHVRFCDLYLTLGRIRISIPE